MKPSYIIGIVFVWIVAVILTGIAEMHSGVIPADEMGRISALMTPKIPEWLSGTYAEPIATVVVIGVNYFRLFITLLSFSFSTIFSGSLALLQVIVFAPIAAGIIFAIMVIIRGGRAG